VERAHTARGTESRAPGVLQRGAWEGEREVGAEPLARAWMLAEARAEHEIKSQSTTTTPPYPLPQPLCPPVATPDPYLSAEPTLS
jgi:hypothetical protein